MLQDFILFFWLPIMVAFVLLAMLTDTQYRDEENIFLAIFHGSFFSLFVGGLIFLGYASTRESKLKTVELPYATYSLVSLNANEDLNGSSSYTFFVGSSYIGEDLYYHFFYKTSKGIRYDKVDARNIYIIETNESPKYVKYGKYYKDSLDPYYREGLQYETREVLYIPKGTIKKNFKVN